MMGSQFWETHYVPPELKENLAELFPGLSFEEALQHQESLYQSLTISCVNPTARSFRKVFDLDLDEAVARSLQELDFEDVVDHAVTSESVDSAPTPSHTEHDAASTSVSRENQDDIDPDRMTYEELRSLGETIGSESRGLSEMDISSLPRYKYKTGFFTKKIEIGECVICYESYKNKQSVTSLPCLHQYHTECINCWLRQNKACPICQKEVKLHD